MWQRFTKGARKAVFYAQEAAQKYGEGFVSTEHLLLGIVRDPECGAARALIAMGMTLERVEAEVEAKLWRGDSRSVSSFAPRGKRVVDLAADEAFRDGSDQVGTEHLLLGVIRERDGIAGRVLESVGINLADARLAVAAKTPKRNRWARFDESAIDAIMAANEFAKAQGRAAISPDHLLLGLLDELETMRLLKVLGSDPHALRREAERLSQSVGPAREEGTVYSPACHAAFLRAYEEQRALEAPTARVGHLLLGLLREPDGVAGRLLTAAGVEPESLREAIRQDRRDDA